MADSTDSPIAATAAGAVAEPSRGFSVYKAGQGYYTRMGTVIGVSLISLLGILWAWSYMEQWRIGEINSIYIAAGGAILIGGIITAITYFLVFVKPGAVDFLIATEGEMKKVNWSTKREVYGSTGAVVVTAVFLALFCWVLELVFVFVFQNIGVLPNAG
jgi:preprotein translocase SecE subunit